MKYLGIITKVGLAILALCLGMRAGCACGREYSGIVLFYIEGD